MQQARLEEIEAQLTTILMGWGITSTALGSALWVAGWRSGRRELLRFGRQTALWGATDAAIAWVGAADRRRRGELDPDHVERKAHRLLITLVGNGIADVAYVAGGARVWSRTRTRSRSRTRTRPVPALANPGGVHQERARRSSSSHPDSSHLGTSAHSTYLGMGRGDGAAIMVQGTFLLALDAAFALRLARERF